MHNTLLVDILHKSDELLATSQLCLPYSVFFHSIYMTLETAFYTGIPTVAAAFDLQFLFCGHIF